MARRKSTAPDLKRPANLSAQQVKQALPKLRRRLAELEAVEINDWNDELIRSLNSLRDKADQTMVDVFGADTLDYERYEIVKFDDYVPFSMGGTDAGAYIEDAKATS